MVYIVPVTVTPPGGCPYKAAAKLAINDDPNDPNYELVMLYSKDPATDPCNTVNPTACDEVVYNPDVQGLREVGYAYDRLPGQVGDGAGDLEDAVKASRRELHLFHG